MTIDDPTRDDRRYTETHDRILQALVERVHDMSIRLAALEEAAETPEPLAPPAVPTQPARSHAAAASGSERKPAQAPADRASRQSKTARPTGWQPTRR